MALAMVLILVAVLGIIVVLSTSLTLRETRSSGLSTTSLRGFYAAEGGLNKRASDIRLTFYNYGLPDGTGPTSNAPCTGTDQGSGDLACVNLTAFSGRKVSTYVQNITQNTTAGDPGTVEAGNPLAGLSYLQFSYRVNSVSTPTSGPNLDKPEAKLQMEFQSRLIPIFQFAAFYQGDLEIGPGAPFTLNGRVHSNADLFLGNDNPVGGGYTTNVNSTYPTSVTAAGNFYGSPKRGDKACYNYDVNTHAAVNGTPWGNCQTPAAPMTAAEQQVLSPKAIMNIPALTTPKLTTLTASPDNDLWTRADLRIVAFKFFGSWYLKSEYPDGTTNVANTLALNTCSLRGYNGANKSVGGRVMTRPAGVSTTMYDRREDAYVTMIDVDVANLMTCIAAGQFTTDTGSNLKIDDNKHNGLVVHLSFDDPGAAGSGYGVRLGDAATLGTGISGMKSPVGVSFVSDQPAYLQGDYNVNNKIPAAVMADTINVLSNAWDESKCRYCAAPNGSATTYNTAFLGGTDVTVPGVRYSGGLENYPRMHETWNGNVLKYRGSFVSLGPPLHAKGEWVIYNGFYGPPDRNFDFDTSFNDASKLPPLTPRIVYVRQIVFDRLYQ